MGVDADSGAACSAVARLGEAFTAKLVFWLTPSDRQVLDEAAADLHVTRALLLRRALFHGFAAAVEELSANPRPGYDGGGVVPPPPATRRRGPRRQSAVAQLITVPHYVAFPDAALGGAVRVVNGGLPAARRPRG